MATYPVAVNRRRERWFFSGMALLIGLTVFAGFSRTYYLRGYFGSPQLTPLLHLHGAIFTSWLLLFITQNMLVATNRTRVHRRLGVVGGVLAVAMIVVGALTAVIRTKQAVALTGDIGPLRFLVIPFGDLLVFSGLVIAGFYYRRKIDIHKRLMLLATIAILAAAVARLPGVLQAGPIAFFGLADLFIVACVAYDLITRRRIHPATLLGGLAIIASQPLRLMLAGTELWLSFAKWLTS